MRRHRKQARIFIPIALAGLLCAAGFAPAAAAGPAWRANGELLEGPEATLGHAGESSLAIAGLTITCEPFVYAMTISTSAGTGVGSITGMPLHNCATSFQDCTVTVAKPQNLPWAAELVTVSAKPYLVIEGFELNVLLGGEECVLSETWVAISGSAGGSFDNQTESVTFDSTTFGATGTALESTRPAGPMGGHLHHDPDRIAHRVVAGSLLDGRGIDDLGLRPRLAGALSSRGRLAP